ncbi:hypothetical protein L2E82_12045 [Cichorium intybus]|uniref:Uncharacterized protein n=1 Tax=Cichorium intybus TaxID=13427 RepID=A0ACB9GEZ5_CICIN|nr:hypothetical protein L2E82_12045 [Cichorium intybus]
MNVDSLKRLVLIYNVFFLLHVTKSSIIVGGVEREGAYEHVEAYRGNELKKYSSELHRKREESRRSHSTTTMKRSDCSC